MRPNPKQLVDYFSRSLTSFHSSPDVFRILCTLPHAGQEPVSRPASGVRRLVVLDSSFNPPTRAHAEMARSALRWASSSLSSEGTRLMLLLAVNNADKAPKPASFPVRLGMMEGEGDWGERVLFFSGGQEPEQIFLAGFDTVIRIFNPKYYGEGGMKAALGPFFERARLRVTMRTDDEWGGEAEQREYVRGLGEGKLDEVGGDVAWAGRVDLVEGTGDGVSSSKVREMVKTGEKDGLERLVDEEVMGWIEREGLYRE
ncbi:hypothetical protein TrVFT333_009703 [Trichoderma virens FT-333]|nr:hypothetical protein TrVFT333_009703 [Trichoderma virens FT-333]